MSQKPAFTYNSLKKKHNDNVVSSPFWVDPKSKSSFIKQVLKLVWKWAKILILIFFFAIGLWGCFQSSFDPTVASSTEIGSGLEFGFLFGTTGNYIYDLSSSSTQQFHSFTSWTLEYGLFYALFVYPGAWICMNICWGLHDFWGGLGALLSLLTLIVIIRALTLAATIKSTIQNEKMSELSGKISEINAKYKNLNDMASRQLKQQEIMNLYKKNNVHPFSAFEQMFLTLPIFLIIYRVVTILRPMKATVLFNLWNFSLVPMNQIFGNFLNNGWTYIFFLLVILPTQFLSSWLPQYWAKLRNRRNAIASSEKGQKEGKKKKLIQYGFTGLMSLIAIFTPCGVGVYWFFNAIMSILQSYVMHRIIVNQHKRKFKYKFDNLEFN